MWGGAIMPRPIILLKGGEKRLLEKKREYADMLVGCVMLVIDEIRDIKMPKVQLMVAIADECIGKLREDYREALKEYNEEQVDSFIGEVSKILSKSIEVKNHVHEMVGA